MQQITIPHQSSEIVTILNGTSWSVLGEDRASNTNFAENVQVSP